MFLAYICMISCLQVVIAESNRLFSAPQLDSLLQEYAFKAARISPKTGVIYDGKVPATLSGVEVAALRLRSGSLRRKGFSTFKEFHIPVGVIGQPYVERVVLVYHNLANLSHLFYSLPGHTHLTPLLGLLAYGATNLSDASPTELHIRASADPISIEFKYVQSWPKGVSVSLSPKCVHFGLDGSIGFDKVVNGTTCLTTNQGHFSIVVETIDAPPPVAGGGFTASTNSSGGEGRKTLIVVGCVVGGALLVFLSLAIVVFLCVKRVRGRKKIERMEEEAELGVVLPMTRVGRTKVPVALGTRTRPSLEEQFGALKLHLLASLCLMVHFI